MPADVRSTILLILIISADTVARLWPYVVGGISMAVLISFLARGRQWPVLPWVPRRLATPIAALTGAASPLPTTGIVPLILHLREVGLPAGPALAFVLASSLMNPQLFILTLGALGPAFALAQAVAVLLLSSALALVLEVMGRGQGPRALVPAGEARDAPSLQAAQLAGHVGLYFLVGVLLGASFQVLLPQTGLLNWLGARGWLASPLLGWLGAPFYTCGGAAIPLASGLVQAGFSHGTLFTFLLVGPALRGSTLANLGCLLPRRLQATCLAALLLGGGLLGVLFDRLLGRIA